MTTVLAQEPLEILVVEDTPEAAKSITEGLNSVFQNPAIHHVTNFEDGLKALLHKHYGLIISDYEFPQHHGEQISYNDPLFDGRGGLLIHEARTNPDSKNKNTPIIMQSDSVTGDDKVMETFAGSPNVYHHVSCLTKANLIGTSYMIAKLVREQNDPNAGIALARMAQLFPYDPGLFRSTLMKALDCLGAKADFLPYMQPMTVVEPVEILR